MKFYLPYVYGISTRAKTVFYKLSFLAYIVIPNLIAVLIYFRFLNIVNLFIPFIMAFTAMYCVYEIGYIQNDTFTIRFEQEPTYRLPKKEQEYVYKNALLLISVRFVTIAVLVFLLSRIHGLLIFPFISMLCILYVGYSFYNSFRNRSNIVSIFFVLLGKYCAIPLLFIPVRTNYIIYLAIIIAIPLFRTVEESKTNKRYKLKTTLFTPSRIDLTRALYYLILVCVTSVLTVFGKDSFMPALIFFSYLFVFRALCYVASKSKKILDNREKCLKVRE